MKKISNRRGSAESGFSLVEMIVAMIIFMVIVGTVYGLLQIGLIDRNRASRRSDVLKNARAAMHLIGRDALNAGLSYNKSGAMVPDNFISTRLGLPVDADEERDVLSSVLGGNNLFFNILNPDTSARTDLIAFAYRDSDFNGGNTISLSNGDAAPAAPATTRLQTPTNEARNVRGYDLYLIESNSSQVAVMVTGRPSNSTIDIAPGDPLGINQAYNGTGNNGSILKRCTGTITENCTTYTTTGTSTVNVASVKRFFWVSYKVNSDGTLVRTTFGNNAGATPAEQIQEMPVAYNIENFQVVYILEDGSTTENPAAGADGIPGTIDDTPENFNFVRQVTVTITVQATERDEQLGEPESITLTGTFSTRNLEYDAG